MSAMLPPGSAPVLPTGTVTFVFTDIEGSTRRWEGDRAAMERALRRHDALVRETIVRNGGHVFKTIGDAFCAAFARPEDAVAAMLEAQRALAAEDFSAVDGLRIRAAIHTGTADERDGDYFGLAVNRVARLLAIGHGGQVILSGVTADIVQGALPVRASLRDLGEHRLRDLSRPEYVYQLVAPDLVADFPRLRSLETHLNNLPLQVKSFVGRENEIAEITALLGTHRLVTLVGSGGVGKTRTSLQVAANFLDESTDGVWFVELAPLANGEFIPSTVALVAGIALPADGDPLINLVRALKAKRTLLIFDNCEHLVEAAARLVSAILRECPSVKMLCSSRQGLGVEGEETYRLPSLDVPFEIEANHLLVRDAMRSASISLFVERARAVDKRFVLSDTNVPAVAEICARLDGIPLAIELAAARVKLLSPSQLRQRLDERFGVLTGGSRDALPRQQTLRATIDWSYDLLDEPERALFRRLSVFVNGFTLAGAVAFVDRGVSEDAAFDTLASLVDKSLVLAEPDGDALRYRLLESTRFYARDKLALAGERGEFERRHIVFLRDVFAEARDAAERTARPGELEALFAREFEDVRAAVDNALRGPATLVGAELVAAIGTACQTVGYRDGIGRAGALLAALPDAPAALLARLWVVRAVGTGNMEEAHDAVSQAKRCALESNDPGLIAEILVHYARRAAQQREIGLATAALDEAGAASPSAACRIALREARGFVALFSGDYDAAAPVYEALRNEHRALGNVTEFCRSTVNLAECEHMAGRARRGATLLEEVLPTMERSRNRQFRALALQNYAAYLAALGDVPAARAAARESIRELAPFAADAIVLANSMEHLALTFALDGDVERAAALAGYADRAQAKSKFIREFSETVTHDRITALLRERLGSDVLARKLDEGAALAPDVAVALALQPP